MLSAKWQPFCPGEDELTLSVPKLDAPMLAQHHDDINIGPIHPLLSG